MEEPWLSWLCIGPPAKAIRVSKRGDFTHVTRLADEKGFPQGQGCRIPWTRLRELVGGCREVVEEDGCVVRELMMQFDEVVSPETFASLFQLLQAALEGDPQAAAQGLEKARQVQAAYTSRGESAEELDVMVHTFQRLSADGCDEGRGEGGEEGQEAGCDEWGVGGVREELFREDYALRRLAFGHELPAAGEVGGGEEEGGEEEGGERVHVDVELMLAAGRRSGEDVRQCLEAGARVEARDGLGRTALHWAARGAVNNETNARILLHHGADVNAQDHDGWTPLTFASFYGRAAVVRLLLRHGADLNLPSWGLRRALHWAADRGQVACVI